MKKYLLLVIAIAAFASALAKADIFDDKARAAAQQEAQVSANKAQQKALASINENNTYMVRRIPRGASNVLCFDRDASWYRKEQNGCRLANSQWNGIAVQVCSETFNSWRGTEGLPPEIVQCHYHLPNNLDCEMYRNSSIRPKCL